MRTNRSSPIVTLRFVLLLATMLAGPAVATQAAEDAIAYPGLAGVTFPELVGPFLRERKIQVFSETRLDIGIGYNLPLRDLQIASTVFFYDPVPAITDELAALSDETTKIKAEIVARHRGARLVAQNSFEIEQPAGSKIGTELIFHYREAFVFREQALESVSHLFVHDGHFIAFRHTYPREQRTAARTAIRAFMTTLQWAK